MRMFVFPCFVKLLFMTRAEMLKKTSSAAQVNARISAEVLRLATF